ncbi:hypothetical protein [Vibrio cincinnatiensis]
MFFREEDYSECDICGREDRDMTFYEGYYHCSSCLSQELYNPYEENENEEEDNIEGEE